MDKITKAALGLTCLLGVGACSQFQSLYPDKQPGEPPIQTAEEKKEPLFGPNGFNLFGGDRKKADEASSIGVNAFLWRASLDTIAFMPLASADPFGGVIITDWYAPPESNGERFKLSVLIMDRALRSDGVRVSVFRQTQSTAGNWVDSMVDAKTATDLENAILTRARELRAASSIKN